MFSRWAALLHLSLIGPCLCRHSTKVSWEGGGGPHVTVTNFRLNDTRKLSADLYSTKCVLPVSCSRHLRENRYFQCVRMSQKTTYRSQDLGTAW